jgi:hypothetical protein
MSANRRIASLSRLSQTISNFAVIVGTIIIVPMYFAQRNDNEAINRQQYTMTLFQTKYNSEVSKAYLNVSYVYDANDIAFPVFKSEDVKSKNFLAKQIIKQAGLGQIKIVIDYYSDILLCMQEGFCDPELVKKLILPDAQNFYCKAKYVGLPELRAIYDEEDYGALFTKFADSKCG